MPKSTRAVPGTRLDAMPRVAKSSALGTAGPSKPNLKATMKKTTKGPGHENVTLEGKAISQQKRRAALGEITNAFAETTSQAKKGLSKMLSKSRSNLNNFARTGSVRKSLRLKESKKETHSLSRQPSTANTTSTDSSSLSLVDSLPSSNEVVFNKKAFPQEVDSDDEFITAIEENDEDLETEKRPLPPDVINFDAEGRNDPLQVTEYVQEIFQYYKDREAKFSCPDYMKSMQKDLTPFMRTVLVDWLVGVQESFELNHETLYTAVKMIDLYLSKVKAVKEELQLIGATAALISCKLDERIPPILDDFVYVSDRAFTKEELRQKETEMIAVLNFDLGFPLSYRYLRRYARVCKVDMVDLTFARYILETSLMEYSLNVETSESKLAAAVLILAIKIKKNGAENWEKTLEYFSGYNIQDCKELVMRLHKMILTCPFGSKKTIRTKYEHPVFHRAAKTPIPETIDI